MVVCRDVALQRLYRFRQGHIASTADLPLPYLDRGLRGQNPEDHRARLGGVRVNKNSEVWKTSEFWLGLPPGV